MNGNPLNGILTPQARKWLYIVFALALAVVQVLKLSDIDVGTADDILTVIGGLFGLTAASNVPTPDTNEAGGGGPNDPTKDDDGLDPVLEPVNTDNGPRPEDGPQDDVIQDPDFVYEAPEDNSDEVEEGA